jgi:hypothetical protein
VSTVDLSEHMREMIKAAFSPFDPRLAHRALPMERCVEILAELKRRFIQDPRTKELVRRVIEDYGADPSQIYFDVPRMRSAFPGHYLTVGIAHAFHPHRDTWYSAPQAQLNWWIPAWDLEPDNCMAFHPRYFSRAVENDSETYHRNRWNGDSRGSAAQHTHSDTRQQPRPRQQIERASETRLLCPAGGLILFSGAQLHETVPNTSGSARFSLDFRTVHAIDLATGHGAPNIDSRCTGTSLRDFMRVSDSVRLPAEIVAMYDDETSAGDVRLYSPAPAY